MIREIFTFDSKDYKKLDSVSFTFQVTTSNLETFLTLARKHCYKIELSRLQNGVLSNKIREYKMVYVKAYAVSLAELLIELGLNKFSDAYSPFSIYRYDFEKTRSFVGCPKETKYISYNPNRRDKWRFMNNTPIVINGQQVIHFGTIYRRYKNN